MFCDLQKWSALGVVGAELVKPLLSVFWHPFVQAHVVLVDLNRGEPALSRVAAVATRGCATVSSTHVWTTATSIKSLTASTKVRHHGSSNLEKRFELFCWNMIQTSPIPHSTFDTLHHRPRSRGRSLPGHEVSPLPVPLNE